MESQIKEQIGRDQAIDRLRKNLLERVDDDHSICRVAAEQGVFCRGFRRYTDLELRQRYYWLARREPAMPREELEDLANQWQLSRQVFDDVSMACDVQQIEHDTCGGWDEFSNDDLTRLCREMLGQSVEIVS